MNISDKENYEKSVIKIKRCVSKILMKGGFFGNFLSEIPVASSNDCQFFSTDGTAFIFNPLNCLEISDEEITWSINQGIIHLALQHFDRKYDKLFHEWNLACDIISHQYLDGICKSFLPKEYQDPRFINSSAEEIYDDILVGKIQQVVEYRSYCDVLNPGEISGSSINEVIIGDLLKSEGSLEENKKQGLDKTTNKETEVLDSGEGNSDKKGYSDKGWDDSGDSQNKKLLSQPQKDNTLKKREVTKKIREITERSSNKGTGNGGTSPALRKFIDNLMNPQVDWKKTLQRYTSEMDDDFSVYKIPNRRHIFQDLYLPGLKGRMEGLGTIVIAIDTSGSIGKEEYNAFIEESRSILKCFLPKEIYIIYCSDGIEPPSGDIDRLRSPGQLLDLEKQKSTGGNEGGFNPPIKWVENNLIKKGKDLACMIYFTDGGAEDPEKPNWHKKIIWAITTDRRIPFGKHINVPINKLKLKK
jgi:predicted metal-dependent peptidase